MTGYIYILSNPAMPGLLKIGFTAKSIEARKKGLKTTGVPDSFVVEASFRVNAVVSCEKAIHGALDSFRHAPDREFFRIGLKDAIERVWAIVKPLLCESDQTPAPTEAPHPFPELTEEDEQVLWAVMNTPRHNAIDLSAINRELGWSENELKLRLLDLKDKGFLAHKDFGPRHRNTYWELGKNGLRYEAWLNS